MFDGKVLLIVRKDEEIGGNYEIWQEELVRGMRLNQVVIL
jgi:hypothetical protein